MTDETQRTLEGLVVTTPEELERIVERVLTEEVAEKITVSVTAAEIARMDALISSPEFRFRDKSHFCWAAIVSFLNFKEKELATIRRGERWR